MYKKWIMFDDVDGEHKGMAKRKKMVLGVVTD